MTPPTPWPWRLPTPIIYCPELDDLLLSQDFCGPRAKALQEIKALQASLPAQDALQARLKARLEAVQKLAEQQFMQAPD